jgi:hypothetical protein
MVEIAWELCSTKIKIFKVLYFFHKNTYIIFNCAKFHVFMICFPKWKCCKMTYFWPKNTCHRTNFVDFSYQSKTSYRLKIQKTCQGFLTLYTGWNFIRKSGVLTENCSKLNKLFGWQSLLFRCRLHIYCIFTLYLRDAHKKNYSTSSKRKSSF